MHRIDGRNTVLDAGGRRLFTDGPPGTQVTATWLTAVQEELCAVLKMVGLALSAADTTQLFQAVAMLAPKYAPWWDVVTYGAIPNLGLDVSSNIQATLDAMAASPVGVGEMITRPGTYILGSPISIGGTNGVEDASKCRNMASFQWNGYNARIQSNIVGDYVVYFFPGPAADQVNYLFPAPPEYASWWPGIAIQIVNRSSLLGSYPCYCISNLEFMSTTSLELGCWRLNRARVSNPRIGGGVFEQIEIDATVGGDDYSWPL